MVPLYLRIRLRWLQLRVKLAKALVPAGAPVFTSLRREADALEVEAEKLL